MAELFLAMRAHPWFAFILILTIWSMLLSVVAVWAGGNRLR